MSTLAVLLLVAGILAGTVTAPPLDPPEVEQAHPEQAPLDHPRLEQRWQEVRARLASGQPAQALAICDAVVADPSTPPSDRLRAVWWAAQLERALRRPGAAVDRLAAVARDGALAATLVDLAEVEAIDAFAHSASRSLASPRAGAPPSTWGREALWRRRQQLLEGIWARRHELATFPADAAPGLATLGAPAAEAPSFLDQLVRSFPRDHNGGSGGSRDVLLASLFSPTPEETAAPSDLLGVVRALRALELEYRSVGRDEVASATRLVALEQLAWLRPVDPRLALEAAAIEENTLLPATLRTRGARVYARLVEPSDVAAARAALLRCAAATGPDAVMCQDALVVAPQITVPATVVPGQGLRVNASGRELQLRWLGGAQPPPPEGEGKRTLPLSGPFEVTLPSGRWELRAVGDGADAQRLAAVAEVNVSSIAAEAREASGGWIVEVVSAQDGRPIAGARVELVGCRVPGGPLVEVSDAAGLTYFRERDCAYRPDDEGVVVASWRVTHGGDSANLQLLDWHRRVPPSDRTRGILLADRTLYRPGDTVRVVAILAQSDVAAGAWRPLAGRPVHIGITRNQGSLARGEVRDGEVLATATATTGPNGRAEVALVLPLDAPLGTARLDLAESGVFTEGVESLWIAIEEPRRPTLELQGSGWRLRDGRVVVEGRANSLVGASLAGAIVSVNRGDQHLRSEVAADGTWRVELPVDGENRGGSIEVVVTAEDGESAARSVHGGMATGLWLDPNPTVVVAGERGGLTLSVAAPGLGPGPARVYLEPLAPAPPRRNSRQVRRWDERPWRFGERAAAWRPDPTLATVASVELRPDPSSWLPSRLSGTLPLPNLEPGAYRVRLADLEVDAWRPLVVVVVPRVAKPTLTLPTDVLVWLRKPAGAGGDAELGVWCAGPGGFASVETVRRGNQVARVAEVACGAAERVLVPVLGSDRFAGLGVRARVIRDGRVAADLLRLDVARGDRALRVDLAAPPATPGPANFVATVRDARGQGVAADVLAIARDRAYDSLGWGRAGSGYEDLWGLEERESVPFRASSLGVLTAYGGVPPPRAGPTPQWRLVSVHPDSSYDGRDRVTLERAVSGREPRESVSEELVLTQSSLPLPVATQHEVRPGPRPRPRRDPPMTALWLPDLTTDKNGRVEVPFNLPDAIGEWAVEVHAATPELALGVGQSIVAVRRPLQVRLGVPRVLRPGDRVEGTVLIDNRTTRTRRVQLDVRATSPGGAEDLTARLGLLSPPRRQHIAAGATRAVPFSFDVPSGLVAVDVVARIESGSDGDAEAATIVVRPAALTLARGDALVLAGGEARSLAVGFAGTPASGRRLEISAWGDSVAIAADALAGVTSSGWGNIDELVRKAAATALLAELAAADPARETSLGDANAARTRAANLLTEVAAVQGPSGALPWWRHCPESLAVSLFALEDLATARRLVPEYADPIARRLLPWVTTALLVEADREHPSAWLLVRGAAALAVWPSAGELGALVSPEQREVVLDAAWEQRGVLSRDGRARLALALTREGYGDRATELVEELLAASTIGADGVLRFAPGARDWASEPDTTVTHATLLQVLLALGSEREGPSREAAVGATAGWLVLDQVANGPERCAAELLRLAQALLVWSSAAGPDPGPRTLSAEVGDEQMTMALAPQTAGASRMAFDDAHVAPDLRAVPVHFEASPAARVVVGARLTWQSEVLPAEASSGGAVSIDRRLLVADPAAASGWRDLSADDVVAPGAEIRVELSIDSAIGLDFVRVSDPRPGGFEPSDPSSGPRWNDRRHSWHQVREDALDVLLERLPAGRTVIVHRLRARTAGAYRAAPARIEAFYTPELAAFSSGARVVVGRTLDSDSVTLGP